jgi:UDP-2,3-diacylglucosamine pyrophosphatase LpxH
MNAAATKPCSVHPSQIVVLGDIHTQAGLTPALRTFFDELGQESPGRLIILGDLVDAWQDNPAIYQQHQDLFEALRDLRQQGWQIDGIRGNRELAADHYLRSAFPGAWHNLAVSGTTPDGQNWRVEHGDHCCTDPGYHLMRVLMRGFWLRAFAAITPAWFANRVANGMRRGSRGNTTRPRKFGLYFLDWQRCAGRLRHCHTFILGHVHQPADLRCADGRRLIVVGDWQATQPGAIVRWHNDGRGWHLIQPAAAPAAADSVLNAAILGEHVHP